MFRPPSLLVSQIVPTAAVLPQGSRDFYFRAERASLPPHAPDMLAVRIQAIDGTGTFTLLDSQPCRLLILPSCYSSYGAWTFTPVGLSPTVHASLRWTHAFGTHSQEWFRCKIDYVREIPIGAAVSDCAQRVCAGGRVARRRKGSRIQRNSEALD